MGILLRSGLPYSPHIQALLAVTAEPGPNLVRPAPLAGPRTPSEGYDDPLTGIKGIYYVLEHTDMGLSEYLEQCASDRTMPDAEHEKRVLSVLWQMLQVCHSIL
jgi:hypothetical protein